MRTAGHSLLICFALLSPAALSRAQTNIAAIPFESVPPGTAFVGPPITLGGDTNVQGDLGLSGSMALGVSSAIHFVPPRSGSLVLGPGDFVSADNIYHWRVDDAIYSSQTGSDGLYGTAPVHLPLGAAVTGMRCWFYDNDPAADFASFAGARLNGRAAGALSSDLHWLVAGLDISHQANSLIEALGTESSPVVVDATTSYSVVFNITSNSGQAFPAAFRFYGCRIDYEVSTWVP